MTNPDAFVGATHRLRDEYVFRRFYGDLFRAAMTEVEGDAPRVELLPIYGVSASCETVATGDGLRLIYDQHLGDLFTELNRLWLHVDDPRAVEAFGLKLASEHLQGGDAVRALRLALAYRSAEGDLRSAASLDTDVAYRAWLTTGQELYVIAHEVVRSALRANPDRYASAISEFRARAQSADLLRTLTGWAGDQNLPDGSRGAERLSTDDAFAERCVCDELAIPIVYRWMSRHPGFEPEHCRSVVLSAVSHLQTLASVFALADGIELDDVKRTEDRLRIELLAGSLDQFPPLAPSEGGDRRTELASYAMKLQAPLTEGLRDRLDRLATATVEIAPVEGIEVQQLRIDELLGNVDVVRRLSLALA